MFAILRLLPVALAVALLVGSGAVRAEKKYGPGVTDTEIKIGQTMPYSGPASAYGTIGQCRSRLLREDQCRGRHQRAQDQADLASTTATARRRRSSRRASWSSRKKCCAVQPARHADQHGDPQIPEREEGAAARSSRPARRKWGDPQNFPWTMGWLPHYRSKPSIYASYILQNQPERQDRACCTRTTTSARTISRASRTALGDKAAKMIVAEVVLRGDRSHRRFADRDAQGVRRRHVLQLRHAEVRGPGDPQGLRHRLEAAALRPNRFDLGRRGADARRPGEVGRRDHLRLRRRTRPTRSGRTTRRSRNGSPG